MTLSDNKQLAVGSESTSLASPKDMVAFASTLKQFIVEQRLYTSIQGKNYVHVEAWQFAGASMGIMPITKLTERVITDDPGEYKYRVEVELKRIDNDQVVGSGVAFCSNRERNKRSFEEYAVVSMAQTRAISKAYRNAFGWLMKVAGYEATPHEEMDGVASGPDISNINGSLESNAVLDQSIIKPAPRKEFPDMEREYVEAEPEPITKLQIQRIKSLMKGMGYSDEKIAESILTLDTVEDGENAIAKLKEKGGKR